MRRSSSVSAGRPLQCPSLLKGGHWRTGARAFGRDSVSPRQFCISGPQRSWGFQPRCGSGEHKGNAFRSPRKTSRCLLEQLGEWDLVRGNRSAFHARTSIAINDCVHLSMIAATVSIGVLIMVTEVRAPEELGGPPPSGYPLNGRPRLDFSRVAPLGWRPPCQDRPASARSANPDGRG